jgi:hypothetical protein
MAPMVYSGVRGNLIHENNLKLKIWCQTPFKCFLVDLSAVKRINILEITYKRIILVELTLRNSSLGGELSRDVSVIRMRGGEIA